MIKVGEDRAQSILTGQPKFQGANGLHIKGNTLYVGGSRLWKVGLEDHAVSLIGPEWLTDIDGIEMEANGALQVTPVAGPLHHFCNEEVEILAGEGISSANHGHAENLSLALIPTGFDNNVVSIHIDGNERLPADVLVSRRCSELE